MNWFENDDFWRELYPYMFPAGRFAVSREQVEQILTDPAATRPLSHNTGLKSPASTGPNFCWTVRERATEAAVFVEWVMEDMRRFIRPVTGRAAVQSERIATIGFTRAASKPPPRRLVHGHYWMRVSRGSESIREYIAQHISYNSVSNITLSKFRVSTFLVAYR